MKFWVIWFIGIGITIGTRIAINMLTKHGNIEDNSKPVQVIMNLLASISIILVGGIANGKWLGTFSNEHKIWVYIVWAIIPACLTYLVAYLVLGLYHFKRKLSRIGFIVVFIISIIGWTIPICQYNRNIERTTEKDVASVQERRLLYFCNIPVQEISGEVSGGSIFGNGNISGSISTSDELSYWYVNENNEGKYDSVDASNSKIVFISGDEKPYLEIVNYNIYTKTINHNNGKEYKTPDKEVAEYIFHLPEAIMQYSLD